MPLAISFQSWPIKTEFPGRAFELGEEVVKGIFGEEADVLGEHGEETALEETGDGFRIVAVAFEAFAAGEAVGDVAGDLGGFFGGIEGMGIGPDEAEAIADLGPPQIGEGDAVAARIGEALVMAAGAGELGVKVEGVADVADDEEGRAAVLAGQGGDVAAGLVVGPLERPVEGGATAFAVAGFDGGLRAGQSVGIGIDRRITRALFGLEHEMPAPVEIDEAAAAGAIGGDAGDGALEDIAVFRRIGRGGIGPRHVEEVAELAEEEGVIGPLGGAGGLPAGDEQVDGVRHGEIEE